MYELNSTDTNYGIVLIDSDGLLYSGSNSGVTGEKGAQGDKGQIGEGDKI